MLMDIHDVKTLIHEYSKTNQCFTNTKERLKMLFFLYKQLIEICKQVVQDVFLVFEVLFYPCIAYNWYFKSR